MKTLKTLKTLSTRDALLELRKVVAADAEKAETIKALVGRLNDAVDERAAAVESALGTLESYVDLHTRLHGFNSQLEELAVTVTRPVRGTPTASRPAPQSVTVKSSIVKTANHPVLVRAPKGEREWVAKSRTVGGQKAAGWPLKLPAGTSLSVKEQQFFDLLSTRWPKFTTPQALVRNGVIPVRNHVTAKVNQLRKKGVPIESARQARGDDDSISTKARGYRLIG